MIEVHHFKIWNPSNGTWEIPPSKRTAEAVAKVKGEIIPDTMELVFKTMLDSEGLPYAWRALINLAR
jgi:hypothetical protein